MQCSVISNNRLEYATTLSITWEGPEKNYQEKNLVRQNTASHSSCASPFNLSPDFVG